MIDDILIFDDIVSKADQDFLLNFVINNPNKFDLLENTVGNTIEKNLKPYPGKVYATKNGLKIETDNFDLYEIIHSIETNVCKKLELQFLQNSRQRINWLEPLGREYNKAELIHWDTIEQHYVIIYYVNDSDGDTIIFNEHLDGKTEHNITELTEVYRETPKAGTGILFNSQQLHTSTTPKITDRRVVINYVFEM